MRHSVRRREAARSDVRRSFVEQMGCDLVDLSGREELVAELTGPLVIDRARNIGFCGLSERCSRAGAEAMHEAFGLALTFVFELDPAEYHTNVVLAVLAGRALVVYPQWNGIGGEIICDTREGEYTTFRLLFPDAS